jgi:hypothetical protein
MCAKILIEIVKPADDQGPDRRRWGQHPERIPHAIAKRCGLPRWGSVGVPIHRHSGECLPDLRVSTAPNSTGKFCIDAVPHTVLGTNAGRVSCR